MIRKTTMTGMIAAIYVVLTFVSSSFGFGAIQFRISEMLCLLPFLYPYTGVGVILGCLISNMLMSPFALDWVMGTAASLIAVFLTSKSKNVYLAAFWPVVVNGFFVSLLITFLSGGGNAGLYAFYINFATVAVGEAVVCYLLGIPLVKLFEKSVPLQNAMLGRNRK